MQTIRLRDPWRGGAARRLEWGSSEWAAESCLADWSTFERQWLGPLPIRRRGALPDWAFDFFRHLRSALRTLFVAGVAAGSLWLVLSVLPALLPA